jgi:hypothetical protein
MKALAKAVALFGAACVAIIAGAAWLMTLIYQSPAAQRAVWTSAAVAGVVQLVAFVIVKLSARKNVIAGWGASAVLRFVVLAVYALVFVESLALPSAPALISLAAFFFASTLVEPLLLKG